MVLSLRRSPSVPFWNRAWVVNVLPLASSLVLHVTLIVLGIVLYQAVQQVNRPDHHQVIIPETGTRIATAFVPIVHPGIADDPTRQAMRALDPVTPPDGVDTTPKNNFPAGGIGDGSPTMPGVGPGTAKGFPGEPFGPGSRGLAPWGPPGGGSGTPSIVFPPEHARKVVYLCDCSGSMLGVFGRLKQELKQQIAGLDLADGQQFNIIFFSDGSPRVLFADGLHIAGDSEKKLADDFIDNAVAAGGTVPVPAIKLAMTEKPDLIYLLTDGFDQVANFDEVVRAFSSDNREGQTHVDCIFLQADEDPKLEQVLRQIADEAHGHFRKILKSEM